MMKDNDTFVQVKRNNKQVRFHINIEGNWFQTDWINYNVVDFTNRTTALVAMSHDFNVEIRYE